MPLFYNKQDHSAYEDLKEGIKILLYLSKCFPRWNSKFPRQELL